ncbi:MAG: CBS domain-containing protein [Myxococcales bacterium]|nr:CBS domain-containing protein [Myxococcales bacterium]
MKRNESIRHIMSTELVTAHPGERLSDVRQRMLEHKVHHLPVVDGGRFIGLITSNDIMRVHWGDFYSQQSEQAEALLNTVSLRETMQEDVLTIKPSATVRDAVTLLSTGTFHSLPVVDDDGALVGMVTTTDLLRYLLEQY